MSKKAKNETPTVRKWEGSDDWKRWKEEMDRIKNTDWTKPPHLREGK
jgi:hypothetical protein